MVCLICGSRTSPGSHMCGRCFKRVGDPLLMGATAMDPMADQRMLTHGSVMLMIGPSFMGEIRVGKSLEPGLTFDRMMTSEDRSHLPSFIDRYLSDLGVGPVLRGDEMVPRRELISRMAHAAEGLDLSDERWATPCLRLANVISLAIREAASLPVEPTDSFQMVNDLSLMAEKFYSSAMKHPELERTARGDQALMAHWKGRSDVALTELGELLRTSTDSSEKNELTIKKATVLSGLGKIEEALDSLAEASLDDPRVKNIRAVLEVSS